jgi:hypothetical protein
VKNHPEVMEKVAEVLHLGKHGKSFWSILSIPQLGNTVYSQFINKQGRIDLSTPLTCS